jgi:transcription elongation GreA/GreB family factor
VIELHELRNTHQDELGDRPRDARASGSPGDDDEVLAVHGEVTIAAARIVWLEQLLRSAPILEHEFGRCVSLGCAVRVAGDGGRVAEYVLVGRRREDSARREVSSARRSEGRCWARVRVSSCGWSFRIGVTGCYGSST